MSLSKKIDTDPNHPSLLIGRQIVRAGQKFTIQEVQTGNELKPGLGPGIGTYDPAIIFVNNTSGEKLWGPINGQLSKAGIEARLRESGYSLVPKTRQKRNH